MLSKVKDWFRKLGWPHLAMLVLFGYFLAVGFKGIHYGKHWDENKLLLTASFAAKDKRITPGWYNYPSLPFDITLAVCHTMGLKFKLTEDKKVPSQLEFAHNTRSVFLLLASLSLFFMWRIGKEIGGSPWVGVLAAGLLAANWQFGYHARYVAPDVLMATFALGSLAFLLTYNRTGKWGSLILASLCAGLALGSKYPAGLLVIPLAFAVFHRNWMHKRPWLQAWKPLLVALAVWIGIFFLTSPGILTQYAKFRTDLAYEMNHYATGHRGHNVAAWTEHPARIIQYFAHTAFGEIWALSTLLLGCAGIGIMAAFRQNRGMAFVLLLFPLLYFTYFSSQKVMIVRNYMVLLPIIQVLAVVGLWNMGKWMAKNGFTKGAWGVGMAIPLLAIMINIPFTWKKAVSVTRDADEKVLSVHLEEYLKAHPHDTYYFSPMAQLYWETAPRFREFPQVYTSGLEIPQNAYLVCYSLEPKNLLEEYRANRPDFVEKIWGPGSADFRYYPFWLDNFLLIMPVKYAKTLEFKQY